MIKKLNSKQDVIEWYWLDFLNYCQIRLERPDLYNRVEPTEVNFWKWYISDQGPLGVKKNLKFYSRENVEYA